MQNDRITQLHQLADRAREDREAARQLGQSLARRLHRSDPVIRLPPEAPEETLAEFIRRYIEQVPQLLVTLSEQYPEQPHLERLLDVVCDYYLSPPAMVSDPTPVGRLLNQAYLAHRLLEEINDHVITRTGTPLSPTDLTRANIVAHELIGEPYANELDQAVQFSAELLLSEHPIEAGAHAAASRTPCLAEQLNIEVLTAARPAPDDGRNPPPGP